MEENTDDNLPDLRNLGGRPTIEIDWKLFDKLCYMQATQLEIASFFNCSVDTIERAVKKQYNAGFADYYKKASAGGRMSLRRRQIESAMDGNVTMLIWLGKQYLEQKDVTTQEVTGPAGGPIQLEAMTPEQRQQRITELLAKQLPPGT
jgi:hypothetical protein